MHQKRVKKNKNQQSPPISLFMLANIHQEEKTITIVTTKKKKNQKKEVNMNAMRTKVRNLIEKRRNQKKKKVVTMMTKTMKNQKKI